MRSRYAAGPNQEPQALTVWGERLGLLEGSQNPNSNSKTPTYRQCGCIFVRSLLELLQSMEVLHIF